MTRKPIDDAEQLELPDDEEEEQPAARGTPYITRAGAERLRAELLHLLHVERPKVTAEVSFAASLGDRSENAEYIYGKKRLREIDRRLRFLQKRLEALTVVEPGEQKDRGKVYFGATVSLLNEEETWSRLSAAALRNAARFRWEECTRPLAAVFRELAGP